LKTILITGGTGLLGRAVTRRLAADHHVRVLSRSQSAAHSDVVTGDLRTGAGLREAIADVTAIVHTASDPRSAREVDVAGTARLLGTARAAGHRPHLIYISIVGVDRIPYRYYRAKLATEQAIEHSGLPWTILRTTQFHEFTHAIATRLTRFPGVVPVPRGWRVQPIDVAEVATHLAAAVDAPPGGRLPDLGGPEILTISVLASSYLHSRNEHRRIIQLPVPGRLSAAFRAGANLVPDNRAGGLTWRRYLDRHGPATT
jgi:uncharacterized protein YbjT (DUF2867 family)